MRIEIVGAGAIGGYVGAMLCHAGFDVTLVARGGHLRALRERGLTLESARGSFTVHPPVSERAGARGRRDLVILALKAHQIAAVVPQLADALHAETTILTMQNGLPWWYFYRHGGPLQGSSLEAADPAGFLSANIDPARIVGSVAYASAIVSAPGVIEHVEGTRFALGEPDRSCSPRAQRIAAALTAAGLKAPIETDIRREIWTKVLGNASFNPISVLTRATLREMAADPGVRHLVRTVMSECLAVAAAVGVEVTVAIDQRIDGAAKVGDHKTSMLQDYEAKRPLELDAVTGAVVELADRAGIPVPMTRHVYGLAKLLEHKTIPHEPIVMAV